MNNPSFCERVALEDGEGLITTKPPSLAQLLASARRSSRNDKAFRL
jgi:hypothetical protein